MPTLAVTAAAEAAADAMMKKSKTVAAARSAVCAALSFVLLYLGSTTGVLDFSAAVLGGAVAVVLINEAGAGYAAASVAVCAVLSALFIPDKTVFVLYLTAGGAYPLIKKRAEMLKRPLCRAVKGVAMVLTVLVYLLAMRLFVPSELSEAALPIVIAASFAAVFVLVIYDVFLTRFEAFYLMRLKRILGKRG